MLHVLYIARYRNASMERKIGLLAAQPDLTISLVRPSEWRDEYGQVIVNTSSQEYRTHAVPLLGQANDPHRALYRTLTFAMSATRPDIVHAEEEPDSLAALQIAFARRLFAPKAKLILHTWQNVNRRKRWYVWWVTQTSLRHADAILCANREAATVLEQMGYTGHTAVIPPQGIDTQVFQPPEVCAPSDSFTIAYAGRFVPEKGIDLIIEAVRMIGPPARLLLIGNGASRSALETQANASGIADRISFVAPVPPEQLGKLLWQVDALVLPSRAKPVWKEQFGRILTEAMACKVPVIGSDSGAIPEVIGDAGLVFPEGDATALAECLRKLIESPALCRDLAERGYARTMQYYTQERAAEQTAIFYRRLMVTGSHAKL
jgi:glycosyltransferase involved in cell wall biosynthesis